MSGERAMMQPVARSQNTSEPSDGVPADASTLCGRVGVGGSTERERDWSGRGRGEGGTLLGSRRPPPTEARPAGTQRHATKSG